VGNSMSARTVVAQRAPTTFQLVDIDEDHVKGIASNMLYLVWRFETRPSAFRGVLQLARELGARFREGIGVCHVVEVEAFRPNAETRELFLRLWPEAPVKHYSVIHEGTGFKAASVRAIVAHTHARACRNCAHAVHRTVRDAAHWHAHQQARLGINNPPSAIAHVITSMRARHRERF